MQKLALTNMIADYKEALVKAEIKAANPRATKPAMWQKVVSDLKDAIVSAEQTLATL